MRNFAAAISLSALSAHAQSPDYEALWQDFKVQYDKTYDGNGQDEGARFSIFKQNVDKINAHNAKDLSYVLGINEFADLTSEEFASIYIGGYRPDIRQYGSKGTPYTYDVNEALEDTMDWVAKGGVTPVKNQGSCGSCWAFSTTGAVEGAYFVASGNLTSLSEEDLVQCDHNGDQGCNGGLMDHAFDWVKKNGICSEAEYPYTSGGGKRGTCKDPKCNSVVTVTGHVDVPTGKEDALKSAVSKQPVSVAIEADKSSFQLYKSGVFDSAGCGKQLDHGVLLVGYGTDGGKDYWKVKNSWGASWGEKGYIRLARGDNMCGIAQQPSYPTGATPAPPGPAPGPSPPAPPAPPAGDAHYGNPADGCLDDEEPVRVQGLTGSFCSPVCKRGQCPSDVPKGVTAEPDCVLRSPTGESRCALECESSSECGDARCHKVGGIGICTYKASELDERLEESIVEGPKDEIVV